MKKTLLLIFFMSMLLKSKAQIPTINYDNWQTVNTYSISTTTGQEFNKSLMIEDKLIMIVDTLSEINPYSRKALLSYNTTTRNTSTLAYPIQGGDKGIQTAIAYKTSTPGLTYGVFGCYSGSMYGDFYPVYYTYNSLTSTFASDSINYGTSSDYEGGITHIAMFSPTTNHDTVRFFVNMNSGTQVFKKHINQTSIVPTFASIGIEYVKASIVYNNKLYVAGDSSTTDYALLKESVDGNIFTQPNNINPGSFPFLCRMALLDTLDGKLIIGVNTNNGSLGCEFYSYNGTTLQLLFSDSEGIITSYQNFKKRLWYSTSVFDNVSTASYAFLHSISNGTTIPSSQAFGGNGIDGNFMGLSATNDSLYFAGNKGTFQSSIIINGNNNDHQRSLALNDRYLQIHKLMPPVSSFNYNNNQICLNASETFTSTSQNTDSLHWLKNGILYASSPGSTAWMNYSFGTAGTHTIGLVAFGGTLTDTSFLSVTVYGININIAATNTLVCYLSTVTGSSAFTQTVTGNGGSFTYNWQLNPPLASVGNSTTYTYTPSSWGSTEDVFLIVTDIHGCTATSNTISITTNTLLNIDGSATSGTIPTITPSPGNVILYKYEPTLGQFDSLTYLTTNGSGYYNFPNIEDGNYILQAIPAASTLQTSYYGTNAVMWKDAMPFTHTCASPTTKDINVIPLANIGTGPGVLSGTVYEVSGFGMKTNNEFKPLVPGNPIGGIVVKGGRNPGGQMFTQTTTDANGTYTLSGLPISSDDYFIMVDIPGLDTNGTYHPYITVSTTTITGLDFTVDSIYVNPQVLITALSNQASVLNHEIKLYPNPTKTSTNIQFELIQSANVSIELFDLIGRKTETIIPKNEYSIGLFNKQINTENLSAGIYFIKLTINNSETVIKLIITN